ncbi:MAG: regulatory protein RecX [Candidatus Omnitrophica bacterium]|nr:regulatory protein RecX [Candidatus Omnitrophota bacterium]MDD5027573.1 regulatory protein RecX [Candidatus Omnitrophota bacterium]MDD5661955.1 regulatory protein RecX [Candidatus Omnitrophota bacterium]
MNKRTESFAKARDYAFFLLKFRLRSENELAGRLKLKKIPAETIKEVISFLKEKRFIDDNVFARAWINSRLKKPFGLRRIKQELRQKGVDKEIIEAQTAKLEDYSEGKTVLDLAKGRLNRIKGIDQVSSKRRVYAYLARRGFSPEVIIDTLNQLCR